MIRVNVFCQRSLRSRAALVSIALAASALVVQAQVFCAPKNLSNNGTAEFGQIAVDPSGNINVVWDDFNATNSDIFFSRSTDGGVSFSVPKNVSNNTGASVFPGVDAATNRGNIAVDSSGNINVVWDDFTPGNSQISLSRSTDGSATFS